MSTLKIAVVVGSLRRESINRKLALALAKLAEPHATLELVEIGDLPLYNQDDEGAPTAAVQNFRASISAADGVLFVTPEFNRSIPGALKNAIDHGSRPYGKSSWVGKPAGVMGISPGAMGTALAQQHLRTILAHLDMPTLGQPEMFLQLRDGMFEADGSFGAASRPFLQGFLDRYVTWVRRHAA